MCHRTKVCHKTKNYLETSIICSCMVWATDGTLKYDRIQSVPVGFEVIGSAYVQTYTHRICICANLTATVALDTGLIWAIVD